MWFHYLCGFLSRFWWLHYSRWMCLQLIQFIHPPRKRFDVALVRFQSWHEDSFICNSPCQVRWYSWNRYPKYILCHTSHDCIHSERHFISYVTAQHCTHSPMIYFHLINSTSISELSLNHERKSQVKYNAAHTPLITITLHKCNLS